MKAKQISFRYILLISQLLLSYPVVTNNNPPNLNIFRQEKFISHSPFTTFTGQVQFYSLSPSFWEQSWRSRPFLRHAGLRAEGKVKEKNHMPHDDSESFYSESGTWHFSSKFIGQSKFHGWVWCQWVEKYNSPAGMTQSWSFRQGWGQQIL